MRVSSGRIGVTGIETYDIVEGLVANLKPDAVILIDSLASRRAARINTSIQITDTGISPGSGVGNTRGFEPKGTWSAHNSDRRAYGGVRFNYCAGYYSPDCKQNRLAQRRRKACAISAGGYI